MGFADMPETTIGTRHDAWRMHEFTRNLCQPSLVRLPQPARQALNLTLTANKRPHFWLLTGSKCKSWLERAKFQHTLSFSGPRNRRRTWRYKLSELDQWARSQRNSPATGSATDRKSTRLNSSHLVISY